MKLAVGPGKVLSFGPCGSNKKLSYRRGTARCVVSIEILPIATQQCRNYLYDKSLYDKPTTCCGEIV